MYKFSFQKLDVWNLSIRFTKEVYILTRRFPDSERFGLTQQIKRASVSISSNIAEGSSRKTSADQARFFQYSFSSLMEVLSQLQLAVELKYLQKQEIENLNTLVSELSNKLNALYKLKSNVEEPLVKYSKAEEDIPVNQLNTSTINHSLPSNPELIITPNYQQHYTAIIDDNCTIGKGTKIWHFSHIMSGSTLGKNCNLGQNVVVSPDVFLGNNVKVQNNVSIYTGVTCDDDVFLGPSMVFTNVINPRSAVNRRGQYSKTHVGQGATIGANATIVCGNDIGKFAFIGAGTVVTKYIPDYALVVGNPSKQIGWMSEYGHKLLFDENGNATCPESGEAYKLENTKVTKL